MRKLRPRTVSPSAGKSSTETTKSMFRLPMTTMAGFIGAGRLPGKIDAELLQFFGVIALVEEIPLLAAFGDVPFLRAHFFACEAIDLFLRSEKLGHGAHDFQAHFIRILLDTKLSRFAKRGDDLVRHVGNFVAREFHMIAGVAARSADYLALGNQGVLDFAEHFLVADTLLAHVFGVLAEDFANLLVEPVFDRKFFSDNAIEDLYNALRIRSFDNLGRELTNNLTRQIADEFPGEQHPKFFWEPKRASGSVTEQGSGGQMGRLWPLLFAQGTAADFFSGGDEAVGEIDGNPGGESGNSGITVVSKFGIYEEAGGAGGGGG